MVSCECVHTNLVAKWDVMYFPVVRFISYFHSTIRVGVACRIDLYDVALASSLVTTLVGGKQTNY